MQKSMVHELNPFVTSSVQYGRSSFIHTTHETDFNQLRKSRIQNLPNYRRQDLSGKLNFVVVFQAIQIQRLSLEIETLRIKIKDYQRQLCNYENYEVQIRELTEKCHSYQMQREDHQQAMQKMHKICQQLYNELEEMRARYADIDLGLKEKYRLEKERADTLQTDIEKWRMRYQAMENSKARQMEDMRLQLETQRKSMLQRQMRELSLKHQSQRSILQQQLKKQRQLNQSTRNQLSRMRQQLQQSRIRQQQLRQYQKRLDQYEDKLMLMAQENMRLNEMIRIKKEEIESLKNNVRNFIIKIQSYTRIQQESLEKDKRLQQMDADLKEWAQNYSRLEADNSRNLILAGKAQEYERLLDSSAQEMERMNNIIREKIATIENFKSYNQKLSIELQQAKKVTDQVQKLQNNIQNLQNQNNKLNQQVKSRLQEMQSWKNKFTQVQSKLPLLAQSQNQCKALKQKLSLQGATKTKLSQTITMLQKDLSKAAQMQQTLNKQRQQNRDLQKEIQRLNTTIRNISTQNGDLQKKLGQLQARLREKNDLMEELQRCKKTISMMTQELDRINGVLHEKLQQIKQLKESFNSFSNNSIRFKQIEEQFMANIQETQKLVLKIDEYRRENELLTEKLFNLQNKVEKLQSEAFTANEQKQHLISIVNQKKVQLQDLMGRIQKLNSKISQLTLTQQQHQRLKSSYTQLQQRAKQAQNRLTKQVNRSGQLSRQLQMMATQNMRLQTQSNLTKQFINEFLNIKQQSQQKDKIIRVLLQRVQTIEKCLIMVKRQAMNNNNFVADHVQRWGTVNQKVDALAEWMEMLPKLQEKVDELREENLRLQGDKNMLSIDLAESRYVNQSGYQKTAYEQQRQIINTMQQSSRGGYVNDNNSKGMMTSDNYDRGVMIKQRSRGFIQNSRGNQSRKGIKQQAYTTNSNNPSSLSYISKTSTTTRTILSPLNMSTTSSNKQGYSQQTQDEQTYNNNALGHKLSTIEEDWGREGSGNDNSRGFYGEGNFNSRNWEIQGGNNRNSQANNEYGKNSEANEYKYNKGSRDFKGNDKDYYESQVREYHSSNSTNNLATNLSNNFGLNPGFGSSSSLYTSTMTTSKVHSPFTVFQQQSQQQQRPPSRPSSSNININNNVDSTSSSNVIQTRIIRPNSSQEKVYTYTSTVNSPKYSSTSAYVNNNNNNPISSYVNSANSAYMSGGSNTGYKTGNTANNFQSYRNTGQDLQQNFAKQSSNVYIRPKSPQVIQGQFTRKNVKSPLRFL